MTELYNLHTDGDHYRITKFIDGNPESSYLVSHDECECPAGVRPSCRHRQMLPKMLNEGLCNTHWFWSNVYNHACDFDGNLKHLTDALAAGRTYSDLADSATTFDPELQFDLDIEPAKPAKFVRRI